MRFLILSICFIACASLAAMTPQEEGRGKDGHFHDPLTGEVQPDRCDNNFKNTHPCTCNRSDTTCGPGAMAKPDNRCQTYCRDKACTCVSGCGSMKGMTR